MTVEGTSHAEHTTHPDGGFKHPFQDAPEHVDRINYNDSGTFSLKMKRGKRMGGKYGGPGEVQGPVQGGRQIIKRERKKTWTQTLNHWKQILLGEGATFYGITHTNYWDLIYYGPVVIGSAQ